MMPLWWMDCNSYGWPSKQVALISSGNDTALIAETNRYDNITKQYIVLVLLIDRGRMLQGRMSGAATQDDRGRDSQDEKQQSSPSRLSYM